MTGAAVGIVPAVFTFGLSIPVGAMLGGGAGCVTGAATGAGTGLAAGTAVGYGGYAYRSELKGLWHRFRGSSQTDEFSEQ
mmetsp:Transcript_46437/g.83851  ORF Transcript_46437/g.83851 Transcript_46437/m.83851 type:complete len:80 (-) Transcript_46437:28-267(-)